MKKCGQPLSVPAKAVNFARVGTEDIPLALPHESFASSGQSERDSVDKFKILLCHLLEWSQKLWKMLIRILQLSYMTQNSLAVVVGARHLIYEVASRPQREIVI